MFHNSTFQPSPSQMEDWFTRFWYRLLKDKAITTHYLTPQYQIGPYYTDFTHIPTKTVIEVDGQAYHYATKEQMQYDLRRQTYLEKCGYTVLRFQGKQVRNCAVQVVYVVKAHIDAAMCPTHN